MATLLPKPGTTEDPARLGEPVLLRTDPPGLFGVTEGKVELVCGRAVLGIPASDVTWDASEVVAGLPKAVPQLEGPFKIRAIPAVSALEILEAPITVLPDIKTALEQVAGRLRLLVDLGDGKGPVGKQEIDVRPEDLPNLSVVLQAPTTVVRRAPQQGHRSVAATASRSPAAIVSDPTTGTLALEGLSPAVAQALASADVTAEVRLVVTGLDGAIRADEVRFEPRSDVLGFGFLAAPRFVELGSGVRADRRITVQARVKVQATPPGGETIQAAEQLAPPTPITLRLQALALPTMLALFRHRKYALRVEGPEVSRDGFVLLVVPPGSPLAPNATEVSGEQGMAKILKLAPLDPTKGVMFALKRIPALAPVVNRVEALVATVRTQPHFVLRRAPIDNLNEITMIERSGLANDTEAEDQVSSLMLFGRPGTLALLFCKRNRNGADGQLNVALTAAGNVLPVGLAALPALPEKPVPSFSGLEGLRLDLTDPALGVRVTVAKECKIKDKGSGRFVFADAFSSVDLALPAKKG